MARPKVVFEGNEVHAPDRFVAGRCEGWEREGEGRGGSDELKGRAGMQAGRGEVPVSTCDQALTRISRHRAVLAVLLTLPVQVRVRLDEQARPPKGELQKLSVAHPEAVVATNFHKRAPSAPMESNEGRKPVLFELAKRRKSNACGPLPVLAERECWVRVDNVEGAIQ